MEYLIGSLDDDGLLRKDLDSIVTNSPSIRILDVSEQKLEKILHILQTFDPAGIGARNLQECLLLQVKRMPKGVLRKVHGGSIHRLLRRVHQEALGQDKDGT